MEMTLLIFTYSYSLRKRQCNLKLPVYLKYDPSDGSCMIRLQDSSMQHCSHQRFIQFS